mgnify:CR=1 FL=1
MFKTCYVVFKNNFIIFAAETRVSGLVDAEQLRCQVQLVEEGQRKHGKK